MFSLLEILFKNKYILSFLNFLKYAIVVCIIPPLLNYAALNRETPVLGEHGLPYDVGSGQKLFLSCKGKGKLFKNILFYSLLNIMPFARLPKKRNEKYFVYS